MNTIRVVGFGLLMSLTSVAGVAQDTLYFRTGEAVAVKIDTVRDYVVLYKFWTERFLWRARETGLYLISKIRYENGNVDIITVTKPPPRDTLIITTEMNGGLLEDLPPRLRFPKGYMGIFANRVPPAPMRLPPFLPSHTIPDFTRGGYCYGLEFNVPFWTVFAALIDGEIAYYEFDEKAFVQTLLSDTNAITSVKSWHTLSFALGFGVNIPLGTWRFALELGGLGGVGITETPRIGYDAGSVRGQTITTPTLLLKSGLRLDLTRGFGITAGVSYRTLLLEAYDGFIGFEGTYPHHSLIRSYGGYVGIHGNL